VVALRENLNESFPAVRATVAKARHAVAEVAVHGGATDDQLDAVRLAVSEAVTNSVLHAYPEEGGEVHVIAALAGGELWVLVADDGRGFQRQSKRPGQGWGLALIAEAADNFEIATRSTGGTELRMRFSVGEEMSA
jgi:anti-sigma regulatory factor (Ser/Thr protein kinase)